MSFCDYSGGMANDNTGYQSSFTCGYQIEGVDADTAARIAQKVERALAEAFAEAVRDAAEVGPDRRVSTYVEAQQRSPEEYDA